MLAFCNNNNNNLLREFFFAVVTKHKVYKPGSCIYVTTNMGRKLKTISISPEFEALAKKYHLSWTEAGRVGMAILLTEVGEHSTKWINEISIFRKIATLQNALDQSVAEISKLREELEK